MSDRPYLGISFRWVREIPDTGVQRDQDGLPHSAVFVMNHGTMPAVQVRFAGRLALMDAAPSGIEAADLSASDEQVCQPAVGGGLPLWYQIHGAEPMADNTMRLLVAVGRVEYADCDTPTNTHHTEFCAVWTVRGWQNVFHRAS